MGERQHKVFAEGIHDTEGEIVLVKLAKPGIHTEVIQHVMHPAHIPLEVKPKPSDIRGPGNHRPSC